MNRTSSSRKNSSATGPSAPERSTSPVPDTSTGLLRNISQGASGERWPEFVARYKPVLEYYLGGMAKADPRLTRDLWDDIEQETFIALLTTLPEGRFSGQSKAIFLRLAAKQATVRELAAEYGLEENAIHQLNHRITKRFQEKADALRAGGADIVDLLERLAAEAGATEP